MTLFYDGYDPAWILGINKGPPIETKPKPAAAPPPKKEPEPIVLKVPFCCEKCKEDIYKALLNLEGVDSVKVERDLDKATITGKIKPEDCLKGAQKIAKRTEFWPKKKEEKKDEKKDEGKKDEKKK